MEGRTFRSVLTASLGLAGLVGFAWAQRAEVPKSMSVVEVAADVDVAADEVLEIPAELFELTDIPAGVPESRITVHPDGSTSSGEGSVAGLGGETLVYSNILGNAVFGPTGTATTSRIADDITTIGVPTCPPNAATTLSRFVIKTTGDRLSNGSGANQAYTVTVGLYPSCPNAGSVAIQGSERVVTVPAEQAGDIVELTFFPAVPISLPQSLYLGVRFSRDLCGLVVGTPTDLGFSADRFDFPGVACSAGLGGFPLGAHASFYAQFYTNNTCGIATPGYKNAGANGAAFTLGTNIFFADNLQLGVTSCRLKAWEITHKGNGFIIADLRSLLSNTDPFNGGLIPGTRANCSSAGNNAQVCRFQLAVPVELPSTNIFMVFRTTTPVAGPCLTCRQSDLGNSQNLLQVYSPSTGQWEPLPGTDTCARNLDITLFCDGLPPLGACCDMQILDEDLEAVCRDEVAEMNCAFPEKWVEGERCLPVCNAGPNVDELCVKDDCPNGTCNSQVCIAGTTLGTACTTNAQCDSSLGQGNGICAQGCTGGTRNGLACTLDDCPSGTCQGPFCRVCNGGSRNGLACTLNTECPGGGQCNGQGAPCSREADCPGGTCFGSPFFAARGCGLAACCKPADAAGDACVNLTRNECFAVPPVQNARLFARNEFCGENQFDCPNPACLSREGECTQERDAFCVDGLHDGEICGYYDATLPCQRGFCSLDSTHVCTQDSGCLGHCVGGPNVNALCSNDSTCTARCQGGTNNNAPCQTSAQCPGGVCPAGGTCVDYDGVCFRGICEGGSSNEAFCLQDDCPEGTCLPNQQMLLRCVGGSKNGLACSRDDCPDGTCNRGQCVGTPGCEDAVCCSEVCDFYDPFCCFEHWDHVCAATAFDICEITSANDKCFSTRPTEGAQLIGVPSVTEGDTVNSTTDDTDPGFCCHTQEPGAKGSGTIWYRFVATDTTARLETCCSVQAGGYDAKDSLIQVFAVADPDRGKCTNGNLCSVDAQNCSDASVCQADREYACNNLVPIGCNDDSNCTCTGFSEPLRSRICVSGLIPGDTYYALVAAKSSSTTDAGKYSLVLSSPCDAVDPLPNDFCNAAEIPAGQETHANYPLVVPFDLSGVATGTAGATFDCPGPLCASGDGGFAFTMTHDAWYDWTPACSGQAVVETCGGSNDNTPDTGLVVYQGCDCPVSIAREMACSFFISTPCFLGSRIPGLVVTAGQCYKFRLSGNLDERPAGDLTISLTCIPVCGDGVREGAEECDDGNLIPGDGCSATCTTEAPCPAGVINFTSPPHGVIDARQPFPPSTPGSPQGISSITYTGPVGSEDPACWTFCETAAAGGANSITGIVDNGGGSFTINLARVITPNAVTTLTYTDGVGASQRGEFTSHPANVNGDSASSPADIIFLIDILNGVSVPPWGLMSTDADQSNAAGPPDILRVIDMLNGAAGYPNQLNRALPVCGVCCP